MLKSLSKKQLPLNQFRGYNWVGDRGGKLGRGTDGHGLVAVYTAPNNSPKSYIILEWPVY